MEISGSDPNKTPTYRDDFKQSVDLFQKSFDGYQHSSLNAQKDQYVKVMKESLQVMQDAAGAMLNKHLGSLKAELSSDLNQYLDNPTDANKEKVITDINHLKDER